MNHISVIVWALCMLQSVSAFAPEPSSDEITPSLGSLNHAAVVDFVRGSSRVVDLSQSKPSAA